MAGYVIAPELTSQAACKGITPDVFFPDRGAHTGDIKAICDECSIIEPCLDWAIGHESQGIWGGTSEKERVAIRRRTGVDRRLSTVIVHPSSRENRDLEVIPRRKKSVYCKWCGSLSPSENGPCEWSPSGFHEVGNR